MMHLRMTLVLATILVLTTLGYAQDDYANGLLDRDAVIESAKPVTLEAYPNADDVLVDDLIRVRYEADGTAIRWDDTFVKILTDAGKEDHESLRLFYTLPYTEMEVMLIEVIKPDGTVTQVDIDAQSETMVDDSQMYMNIFDPNHKILQVGIPDLEVGDLLRYVFVKRTLKPRMPNSWVDLELLEYTAPYKRFVYEIDGPAELPLASIALKDEIEGTVTYTTEEADGRVHYRWEATDVPRMFIEPRMPSPRNVAQRVRVSTNPDWQTVSRWYWNLCEPHIDATTPEMDAKVAELTEGRTDRQEQIEAIFYWVAQQVRYMGITTETEAPGYEPHDVSITFENKYGVCRDKGALLVAMLRLAGFEAEMVLIHAGDKRDYEVPDPYFNHAIVAVREDDGTYQLMDPTNETTKQLLSSFLSDRNYLVATEEGDDLKTSPIIPAEENLLQVDTTGVLSPTGTLTLTTRIQFNGAEDDSFRGLFSRLRPEEREQYIQYYTKTALPGATLKSIDIAPTNMQDTDQPLVITLEMVADDFPVSNDQCALLDPPFVGQEFGMSRFLLNFVGLEERKYPFKTFRTSAIRESISIELPEHFINGASLPTFDTIDDGTVTWSRSLTLDGNTLHARSEFMVNAVEFSPGEYLTLKEHLATIDQNERKKPIFVLNADPTDSLITPDDDFILLNRRIEIELTDAHNWTERRIMRKKVLTHAGRESESELRIGYNPALHTITLVNATVTSPDGTVKTVREEEINLMDAPWVASAPRYPAGKMLVANLPNVEIGSIIDYEVLTEHHDRPFFSREQIFQTFDPMVTKTLEIRTPSDLPLTIRSYNDDALKFTERTEGDTIIYEWSLDNQPGIASDYMVPPFWMLVPSLHVSVGDWSEYASLLDETLDSAVLDSENASAKTAELIDGLDTDEAKVLAIRDFIARQVRPLGMYAFYEPTLEELPLSAISPADQILTDGYGNATDRAVLLVAMLRAAGFDPAFIVAQDSWDLAHPDAPYHTAPQIETFQLVLVQLELDGEVLYLNEGDQYWALGATEHNGLQGLDVKTGQLVTIEASPGKEDMEEVDYHVVLDSDGNATITITARFHGETYGQMKKYITEMPPELKRREHMELITEFAHGATPESEWITNFDAYPGTTEFTIAIDSFAVRDGDHLYLTLPEDIMTLQFTNTDSRTHPLHFKVPHRQKARVTLEMPDGFEDVLLSPPTLDWTAPDDMGLVTVKTHHDPEDPSTLTVDYALELDRGVISAEDYPEIRDIRAKLSHANMRTFVLKRTGDE